MSWTRIKLTALSDAMQKGVLSVSAIGKTVTYASFAAMREAYEYGLREVEAIETGVRQKRSGMIRLTQTGTGLQ